MINWAREIKQTTLLKWNGVHDFSAKIGIKIESNSYILKTAETAEEIAESCQLRHRVFFPNSSPVIAKKLDIDRFDSTFDHLLIISKKTNRIVGTYRLSLYNGENSYTSTEFNLSTLPFSMTPYLELGRACVDPEHRTGSVLSLLWRGIIEYMNISGAHALFGCSSINVTSSKQAALITRYFEQKGYFEKNAGISPTKQFSIPDLEVKKVLLGTELTHEQINEVESLIPSLLKSYLKMGAKIVSDPALDKKFGCLDFLTLLKKCDMDPLMTRRYQLIQ